MPNTLETLSTYKCPMPHAPCPMPYALCPMPKHENKDLQKK
ncbi:MAG: hypothetical protein ACYTXA_10440 [Nostoc sp.]